MTTEDSKISAIEVQKYLNILTVSKRDNDETYVHFKVDGISTTNAHYGRLSTLMSKSQCSSDFLYREVLDALEWIKENIEMTVDELRDSLSEACEPDVMTTELTSWLNQSVYHVYYLTQALEVGLRDGFQALGYAQGQAKQEIWNEVLSLLAE